VIVKGELMSELDNLQWLISHKPKIHQVEIEGREFYLRQPTVADRDRFDTKVAAMGSTGMQMRSPMLQAVLCNQAGQLIGGAMDFDKLPAELIEPLVNKAAELFGISDSPTAGETS